MTGSTNPYCRFEVEGNVAYLTFDSPETRNAYSKEQEAELLDLLTRIQADAEIHAVLVTGEGDVFGGGGSRRHDPFSASGYYERAFALFEAWAKVDKPIVVALNGLGLLTLPLLSDIVIAEEHVEIQDPHVLMGIPTATGSFLWPMSTGLAKAKRYLLSGEAISTAEAERIGLISEVVPRGASKERAAELCRQLASLDPIGVQMTKRALNEWVHQSWGPIFKHAMALEFLHFPGEAYEAQRAAWDRELEA